MMRGREQQETPKPRVAVVSTVLGDPLLALSFPPVQPVCLPHLQRLSEGTVLALSCPQTLCTDRELGGTPVPTQKPERAKP